MSNPYEGIDPDNYLGAIVNCLDRIADKLDELNSGIEWILIILQGGEYRKLRGT